VSDADAAPVRVLCDLDDIPDPGGKGFAPPDQPALFVIRAGGRVHGYRNACPHQGTPLDWKPDTFLTYDKALIQCSTHGAQFRIEDGGCVSGPCLGKALEPVAVCVRDGDVVLDS
jgi:nitrite reductase/ring-hydroxylating ferredoxin subunit